jgi:hypothetical protein
MDLVGGTGVESESPPQIPWDISRTLSEANDGAGVPARRTAQRAVSDEETRDRALGIWSDEAGIQRGVAADESAVLARERTANAAGETARESFAPAIDAAIGELLRGAAAILP